MHLVIIDKIKLSTKFALILIFYRNANFAIKVQNSKGINACLRKHSLFFLLKKFNPKLTFLRKKDVFIFFIQRWTARSFELVNYSKP